MNDAVQVRSRRDLIAGSIFILVALGFGWEATHYDMGRAIRMGPGFIPLLLAGILVLLGVLVIAAGLRQHDMVERTPIPWRGLILLTVAIVIFGAYAPVLGLVPVVALCTFIVAMASVNNTVVSALLIAAAMALLCWLVFKIGLGITLPTFGAAFAF